MSYTLRIFLLGLAGIAAIVAWLTLSYFSAAIHGEILKAVTP